MTNRSDETTADKAARRGMTPDEYRAHRHLAAVRQIRAALPGLYATTGLRVEAALTEPAAVSAVVEPPAGQTTPSHRAGLRDHITTAISKWHRDPEQPLYEQGADAVLAVLYREWPWLRAEAEDAAPPADQTALRDRIRRAICEAEGFMWNEELLEPDEYGEVADAVLAVLPAPADRATVLRDAADAIDNSERLRDFTDDHMSDINEAANELRRMADETATETPEDPARIDRLRPEFTEHASVEAIDAQLDRARRQERRWHLRAEWLIGLRQARADQPAAGARQDGGRP